MRPGFSSGPPTLEIPRMRRSPVPCAVLLIACTAWVPAWGRDLPNYDVTSRMSAAPAGPATASGRLPGTVAQREERRGVPTLVWAEPGRVSTTGSALALTGRAPADVAARAHLAEYAGHWGLTAQDVADLEVRQVHDTGRGAIVVQFHHRVGALPVWRETLSVVLDRNQAPVAFTGWLQPARAAELLGVTSAFRIDHRAAIAGAYQDLAGVPASFVPTGRVRGEYVYFQLAPGAAPESLRAPARARQVLFRGPKGLEPAYYLELETREAAGGAAHAYAYVISARTGSLLVRTSLTQFADPYTYRVWADTTGQFRPYDSPRGTGGTPYAGQPGGALPPFVPANRVSLVSGPISTGDPWLPPGATETRGNNVDAYADTIQPDGFTGTNPDGGVPDLRATTTSASTFDYAYDNAVTAQANANQIQAAVTQLFFTTNWLHDWYYDVGFDEASGNAQASNLGRASGDLEDDPLLAEAEDYSGLNNANMTTPADGASPRMQMYVFTGPQDNHLTVNAPASLAGTYQHIGVAVFGPQGFNVSGDIALVNDGVGPLPDGGTSSTSDGCEGGYSRVAGKVALVDRGSCTFVQKVTNAQDAGAIGVLVANNTSGILNMGASEPPPGITIPSLLVTQDLGTSMKGQLGTGVNVTLFRQDPETILNVDGALDNSIVAHEWGHYIAHRLVGGGDGFNAQITDGMGEGWSDFHALLLTVRPEDASAAGNTGFSGVYPMAQYAWQDGYFGIRRYPYSTDMTKNPLTFAYIQNGKALPAAVPVAPGFDTSGLDNSEVHNTGEVWASMLWECYAALLNDPRRSFQEAQDQMRRYLVAAYKATPVNATFTEARDALLAVALANDPADYQLFGRAFAKRGLGTAAVAPNRLDPNNSGAVESFTWGKSLELLGAAVQETKSCDSDGVVDHDESGKLVVTLRNLGADPVANVTVAAPPSLPKVTFAQGGVATLASLPAAQTAQVELPFDVGAISGIQMLPIDVAVSSSDLPSSQRISHHLTFRLNTDQLPASSATDTVEATSTVWTTSSVPHLGSSRLAAWTRIPTLNTTDDLQHEWWGPDPDISADESLVSPPLGVAASGPFRVTFRARWDEETEPDGNFYDGVVLEISEDNGATWKDVTQAGGTLSLPYNHVLFNDPTLPFGIANPLQGRPAYSGNNPSYGSFDTVTLDFGTAYAGKTVLLRFRLGADGGVGAKGFELDDIAFTGIVGTPFASVVADTHSCVQTKPPSSSGSGGCSASGGEPSGLLVVGLSLLALSYRRRARSAARGR